MVASNLGEELWWGFAPSFSAHVRFGEHGAPVLFPICSDETFESQNVDVCGIPHLAKYERDVGPTRGLVGGIEFGVRWEGGP
jgi:hypothetical protein